MSSERKLAQAVLRQAMADFGLKSDEEVDSRDRRNGRPMGLHDRLAALYVQVQAGEFLLERTDPITRFWFGLSGIDMAAVRERYAEEWAKRLARIRQAIALWRAKLPRHTTKDLEPWIDAVS